MLTLSGAGQPQNGSAVDLDSFIIQVNTANAGTSNNDQFTLPMIVGTYDVDWGDGNVDLAQTGELTHSFAKISSTDTPLIADWTNTSGDITLGDGEVLLKTDGVAGVTEWDTAIDITKGFNLKFDREFSAIGVDGGFHNVESSVLVDTVTADRYICNLAYSSGGNSTVKLYKNGTNLYSAVHGLNTNTLKCIWDFNEVTNVMRFIVDDVVVYSFANTEFQNDVVAEFNVKDYYDITNITLNYITREGTYDVSVTATSGQIYFNGGGDKLKLIDIKQWGTCQWTSMFRAYYGCSNMQLTAIDAPDLTNADDMRWAFRQCSTFNASIDHWDVSTITNWEKTFMLCTSYDQPMNSLDMSEVTSLSNMFTQGVPFNKPLNNWDTGKVIRFDYMFFDCPFFDQDISSWKVSQATNLNGFMRFVTSLSTANYDALLIAWDAQGAMSYSGTVDFGSSTYTLGGAAETARTSLIAKWGGIIDGGGVLDATTNLVASYTFDSGAGDYTKNNT